VDNKKEKKLSQLAAARESAKAKKRQRDEDLSTMKETLNTLTSMISSKKAKAEEEESDEEPVKKQKRPTRITKEPDETEVEVSKGDTWTTSAIRSSALMGLAAASFYFSNIYGKQQQQTIPVKKKAAPVHATQPSYSVPKARGVIVGQSGFSI
jgi:hypothetical protein